MQASKNQQVKGRVRVLSSVRGTPSVIIRSERKAEGWGSTRVLFWNGLLWYRSAIVFEDLIRQYVAVWARFVLITSLLLFCRFSALLTRHGRRGTVDRI
jgi:hypothetical protein